MRARARVHIPYPMGDDMETSHRVAIFGSVIAAVAVIVAALVGRPVGPADPGSGGSDAQIFSTPYAQSDGDCHAICGQQSSNCLDATRRVGSSIDSVSCDFIGVRTATGFEQRAKSCRCQKK